MGLKIARVKYKESKAFEQPEHKPLPIWEVNVKSLLNPLHPFFKFEILKQDLASTIEFRVGLRPVFVKLPLQSYPVSFPEQLGNPFIFGVLPGFLLDKAKLEGWETSDGFKACSQYILSCVAILLSEVIGKETLSKRVMLTLLSHTGGIQWSAVLEYLRLLSSPLFSFERLSNDGSQIDFVLQPTQWWVKDGYALVEDIPKYPVNIAGFDKAEIEAEAMEFFKNNGQSYAEWVLKKYLLERTANQLMNMGWNLDQNQNKHS